MKPLFLLAIIFSSFLSFAQLSKKVNVYYPNGKKITSPFKTIGELLDTLHIKETQSYSQKLGVVYFKRLSSKPLFVLFLDREYPLKIKEIITSYNYSKYLSSYSYYYDLNDMIIEGTLTKAYLKEVFDEPDVIGKNEDDTEYWIFKKYNAKIIFYNDLAQSADVINYKAFERNGLAISAFNVTGSDYTIGFDISLINFSSKIIKYCSLSITATNPVDDVVGTKTVKGVGPIKPSETGSYEFKDVIFSTSAKYLTIKKISLQYMDGSIKVITGSEIEKIEVVDWEEIGKR